MTTTHQARNATDAALLRQWEGGDQSAGAVLYRRHAPALHRFFRSKIVGSDADLMQQTFVALFERADRVTTDSARRYLFGIARNLVANRYRARASADPLESSVVDLEPSLGTVLDKRRARERLLLAVRRISLDDQILIELHYWERLSSTELAEVFGVPPGTIKSRLKRARARLQRSLDSVD